MLKRVSIFVIGTLFALFTVTIIPPATAAPTCAPTTSTNGSATVLKFTTVGTCSWDVPANLNQISILIVAGGGGGGGDAAGGGGAGGVYMNTALSINSSTKNIVVGAGGTAGQCGPGQGSACTTPNVAVAGYYAPGNGGSSTFDAITVAGGGAGGVYNNGAGASGGSGGGGSAPSGAGGVATATGTYFYGNNGGTPNGNGGAGGGGAGAVGVSASGGSGGAGILSSITGTPTYYAGGGGGGNNGGTQSSGGTGGGGAGALSCTYPWITSGDSRSAQPGVANTGGGGGGAPYGCQGSGAAGGSGIVIISYILIPTISNVALSSGLQSATYRTANTIQVTLSSAGKVRFYANGKQIPGCTSVSSISTLVSCTWKPSFRGQVIIVAKVIGGSSTASLNVGVNSRPTWR
ncbi:MAG: glycine-rich domain-containing protein [Candidatus Planktophila sp.]